MADRSRFSRKNKSWFGIAASEHLFTAADTDFGNGMVTGLTSTIIRVLGEYIIGPTSAPTALDIAEVTVGLGIVSSDAFALGETAAPDPASEFGYPWLYRKSHWLFYADTSLDSASPDRGVRQTVDVKGMRKIRQDQTLAWVIQYSATGDSPVHVAMVAARVLLAT